MGRPTLYSDELAEQICLRLASGESLIGICKDKSLPCRSTVFGWMLKDEHKPFLDKYLHARAIAGHACADKLLSLVNELESSSIEPSIAREMSSNLRWSAERMAPRYYSPKQTLALSDTSTMSHEDWLEMLK